MSISWIDSHAHLCEERLLNQIDEVMAQAKTNQVDRIMVITMNEAEYRQACQLKKQYPMLDIAFGYHPEVANELTAKDWEKLEKIIQEQQIVAIGEIGLDFHWVQDNKALQQDVFQRQLALAEQYQLPVIIHSRDAIEMTYELLKAANLTRTGVMHCYGGSVEMADKFIALGYFISVAGVVTFKNAKTIKEVVTHIPIERLLIETDSPFLAPEPYRGKLNQSAYVKYVAEMVALLKNVPLEFLSDQLQKNYQRLLGEKS